MHLLYAHSFVATPLSLLTMPPKTRGERLRDLRFRNGSLTQEELSDMVGITRARYAKFETSEKRTIQYAILEKLAQALKTTVEYIQDGLDAGTNVATTSVLDIAEHMHQLPQGVEDLINQVKEDVVAEYKAKVKCAEAKAVRAEAERDEVKSELELVRIEIERLKKEKGKGGK